MIKIYDSNKPIKMSLERTLPYFLGENANVLVVNIDHYKEVELAQKEGKTPIIFYGFDSEASLRLNGHPAAPYFYSKTTAYFQMPCQLIDMAVAYRDIIEGKKRENEAMMLVTRYKYKQSLVGKLLHDIYPGKYGCEEGLKLAEKEFGIKGTIDEVRTQLEKLRGRNIEIEQVKKIIGDRVIPGAFFDVEGTLITPDRSKVNPLVLAAMEEQGRDKAITLWTGGDVKEIEKLLISYGIEKYPVVSKEIFRNCKIELVYDDLSGEEFQKQYKIKAVTYIQVK